MYLLYILPFQRAWLPVRASCDGWRGLQAGPHPAPAGGRQDGRAPGDGVWWGELTLWSDHNTG